jgi:hypothetical protein
LSVIRLGDEAYGVPIADAIEASNGREVALGSVYITLDCPVRAIVIAVDCAHTAAPLAHTFGNRTPRRTSLVSVMDSVARFDRYSTRRLWRRRTSSTIMTLSQPNVSARYSMGSRRHEITCEAPEHG